MNRIRVCIATILLAVSTSASAWVSDLTNPLSVNYSAVEKDITVSVKSDYSVKSVGGLKESKHSEDIILLVKPDYGAKSAADFKVDKRNICVSCHANENPMWPPSFAGASIQINDGEPSGKISASYHVHGPGCSHKANGNAKRIDKTLIATASGMLAEKILRTDL